MNFIKKMFPIPLGYFSKTKNASFAGQPVQSEEKCGEGFIL